MICDCEDFTPFNWACVSLLPKIDRHSLLYGSVLNGSKMFCYTTMNGDMFLWAAVILSSGISQRTSTTVANVIGIKHDH